MDSRRIFLGAILPIPLYIFGSALFALPSLIRNSGDLGIIVLLWFGYGILIMGIPSILYSVAIEFLRAKENASLPIRMVLGAVMGFVAGSIMYLWSPQLVVLYTMSLPGAAIGGIIPLILSAFNKENKSEMATPRKPSD
jgi:MFS family permease